MAYHIGDIAVVIAGQPTTFSLAGATLTVYVLKPDGSTVLTKSGTIVDATTGQWSWTTASGDFSDGGTYSVQLKAVTGGVTRYADPELLYVDGKIA